MITQMPDRLTFDAETGMVPTYHDETLQRIIEVTSNTPCPGAGGQPCDQTIRVHTNGPWVGGREDTYDLTGNWLCRAGHGPADLVPPPS